MQQKHKLTLRQRVVQTSSWTLLGYGVNQALRLGGNLILTRLLFPEAFGLMAIFQAVNYGVHMFTDVGVGPSIIQKERGNDSEFLNTAWTVQIVRGFVAWVGLCVLALPVSKLYGEPLLTIMLPVSGLNAIIGGFNSTKLHTAERNMDAARVTQIYIGSYAFGLLCTIILAWLLQSVWALVWGSVITVFVQMVASHVGLHGIRNQFAWDRDALDHLRGFGRWILLGSGLTYLSVEGARLLIGALLDMRQLALYTLASTLSLMFWQAMQMVSGRVFFPAYSEVNRSNPKNLTVVLYKARLTMLLPSWSLSVLFVFLGSQIMGLLYDERYLESGPMLKQLAAGTLVTYIWGSYSGILLALGKVEATTVLTAIQIILLFGLMLIGYQYGQGPGLIVGVASSNWAVYPLYAYMMNRYGIWQPKIDLLFIVASILVVVLAWPGFATIG